MDRTELVIRMKRVLQDAEYKALNHLAERLLQEVERTHRLVEIPSPLLHVVVDGDTLSAIALRYCRRLEDLVELNHLKNPDLIYPDQIIYLRHPQRRPPHG